MLLIEPQPQGRSYKTVRRRCAAVQGGGGDTLSQEGTIPSIGEGLIGLYSIIQAVRCVPVIKLSSSTAPHPSRITPALPRQSGCPLRLLLLALSAL